ncbi:cyclic nucleotide-binding domain-containing protein [Scytonema sp. UIC 10036]|uniref:ATP-binding protein n=1 Tax=Scytonema sp. UIC 10036 TaxID=2304196 RepID=UPI0012DA52EC|nr:ATP-binding protein [Scytonema sp. UIC 10036]MUG94851.1 cyclic nucleotide-binding domain-containing protein [Scytonema sp. UIC 10036]
MLCVDDLLKLDAFRQLPPKQLEWVCDRVEPIDLLQGETLIHEGDPNSTTGVFILAKGRMSITRVSDRVEMPIGQHNAPNFFGEVPVLTEEPMAVTMRAIIDCRLYKLAAADFLTLLHEYRDFERVVFRTVERRLRGLESFIRTREKMAALGTLAAGLAHEINNPAAALVRSLNGMVPAVRELERMNLIYGQQRADPEHTQQWLDVRDAGVDSIVNDLVDPITLSDREDELLEWLENYGVEQAWKLATPLASAGIKIEILEKLIQPWRNTTTELRDLGIRWLALSFEVTSMIRSGLRGAERIDTLVNAMKSYSYLDRGAQQIIDVHEGIENTLQLFSHKLKEGITVKRCYDPSLPKISAYGSELNQVWTNLIDNAIDAMNGQGILEIKTLSKGHRILVEITDSGCGIPADIQSRIFEPFFTTKAVGKGSGLGLETARRIVENRHHGAILVESVPGKTCFIVCLPIDKN